jgi:hypothetical protein
LIAIEKRAAEARLLFMLPNCSCHNLTMHILRKSNKALVVVDSRIWVSFFLSCVALLFLYRTIVIQAGSAYYLVAGFIGFFAVLFWRGEVVTFDFGRQQAIWNRCRLFRIASGTVPFSDIAGIGLETQAKG